MNLKGLGNLKDWGYREDRSKWENFEVEVGVDELELEYLEMELTNGGLPCRVWSSRLGGVTC